jgi:hypothetical protein
MGGGEKIIREKIKMPLNYLRAFLLLSQDISED